MLTNQETKYCNSCDTKKSITEFHRNKSKKDGLNSQCKKCVELYRIKNKNILYKYHKEYSKNYYIENAELICSKSRKYQQENKGKTAIQKREYRLTLKGKAVLKNYNHKRRIQLKNGDVTSNEIIKLEQSAKVCYWCNMQLKGKEVHIDHYIPISKGGEHTLSNLVVSCSKCNLSKGSKDPQQFANKLGRLL